MKVGNCISLTLPTLSPQDCCKKHYLFISASEWSIRESVEVHGDEHNNSNQVYSEASPIKFNGAYSHVSGIRIVPKWVILYQIVECICWMYSTNIVTRPVHQIWLRPEPSWLRGTQMWSTPRMPWVWCPGAIQDCQGVKHPARKRQVCAGRRTLCKKALSGRDQT